MKNNAWAGAGHNIDAIPYQASSEFFANVEYHLYAKQESTLLDADESDVVYDFSLQGFSAAACAEHIIARRTFA